jgi:hypothetical protein
MARKKDSCVDLMMTDGDESFFLREEGAVVSFNGSSTQKIFVITKNLTQYKVRLMNQISFTIKPFKSIAYCKCGTCEKTKLMW